MSILRSAATLRNLREQPMWKLLAADRAPVIAALLDNLLLQDDKVLSASTLEERLTRDMDALRAQGYELPYAAAAYVREWIDLGWLSRRLAQGAPEEELSLTTDAANAVRFIVSSTQGPLGGPPSRNRTRISGLQPHLAVRGRRAGPEAGERDRLHCQARAPGDG